MISSLGRRFVAVAITTSVGAACSSSSRVKAPGDAAVPSDLAAAAPDGDAVGPDVPLPVRDLAAPGSDAASSGPDAPAPGLDAPDSHRADQSTHETATDDRDGRLVDGSTPEDAANRDASSFDGPAVDVLRSEAPLAEVSPADTGPICPGQYDACGCGCCGGAPRDMACYYPSAGETLDPIKAKDDEVRSTINCTAAGCSPGMRYVCCLPADPEPSSSATYTAAGWMGDLDHLTISKSGADCAQLFFDRPSATRAGFHLEAAEGWGLTSAGFGPCVDAGALQQARGALGTLALRKSGSACVVDLHATLYGFTAAGEIEFARLDVDGAEVTGQMFCQ